MGLDDGSPPSPAKDEKQLLRLLLESFSSHKLGTPTCKVTRPAGRCSCPVLSLPSLEPAPGLMGWEGKLLLRLGILTRASRAGPSWAEPATRSPVRPCALVSGAQLFPAASWGVRFQGLVSGHEATTGASGAAAPLPCSALLLCCS